MTLDPGGRWAWAEIDVGAIEHNVRVMRSLAAPSAVWAVVKADGYGHGAVRVARAALRAGAEGLCVALVDEGVALRSAGITAPILLLSQQPPEQLATALRDGLIPTVYTTAYVDDLIASGASGIDVHVKLDTGMQRVGAAPDELDELVERVAATAPSLRLSGIYTHLACADEPASDASAGQLARFDAALDAVRARGLLGGDVVVHAANSAAAMVVPAARRSIVRVGIACYGVSPSPDLDDASADLRPALALKARVSHVKRVDAGSHVSYGWRHRFDRTTTVATVPIGYADGVPRRLGTRPDAVGADVLVGGRRCPIVGVVTMDQLMVDVGELDGPAGAPGVEVGDEVVLIGAQGDHRIRAEEWAERLGTIGYEIVCGIGARIPRVSVTTTRPDAP